MPRGIRTTLGHDLHQTWRGLLRRPGYAGMVALTLGLGIGATTTLYSVVDAVLVRPLPYRDSDRLAIIGNTAPGNEWVEGSEGVQRLEVIALPAFRDAQSRANWGQTPISSFQCGHRVPHPKARKTIMRTLRKRPDTA